MSERWSQSSSKKSTISERERNWCQIFSGSLVEAGARDRPMAVKSDCTTDIERRGYAVKRLQGDVVPLVENRFWKPIENKFHIFRWKQARWVRGGTDIVSITTRSRLYNLPKTSITPFASSALSDGGAGRHVWSYTNHEMGVILRHQNRTQYVWKFLPDAGASVTNVKKIRNVESVTFTRFVGILNSFARPNPLPATVRSYPIVQTPEALQSNAAKSYLPTTSTAETKR